MREGKLEQHFRWNWVFNFQWVGVKSASSYSELTWFFLLFFWGGSVLLLWFWRHRWPTSANMTYCFYIFRNRAYILVLFTPAHDFVGFQQQKCWVTRHAFIIKNSRLYRSFTDLPCFADFKSSYGIMQALHKSFSPPFYSWLTRPVNELLTATWLKCCHHLWTHVYKHSSVKQLHITSKGFKQSSLSTLTNKQVSGSW